MDPASAASVTATAQGPQLKYLGFFRIAVLELYVFILQVYAHLKEKSGSLKPSIESVEAAVQASIQPVVSRVAPVSDDYLEFIDSKVISRSHVFLLTLVLLVSAP